MALGSKEAGAAATTAAVTASPQRGSNWVQGSALPGVAGDEEILEFLTGVMRGEEEGSTQTMKAAELLGKRIGLFTERTEPPPAPVIIDDVELASMRRVERESG